jgi:hypothetical protein
MTKNKDLENDYFLQEEALSKHKAHVEQKRVNQKALDEELKALHFMKCPKCGHDLENKRMDFVEIQQCSSCGALVIDADKVEKFIAEEKSILKSLIDLFKS